MARMQDVTAEELQEYLDLEEQRKELDRKSRSIKSRSDALHDKFKAAMEAAGKTHCTRYGYPLSLVEGRAYVAWREVVIEKLGPEVAEEVQASAPRKTKVLVQPQVQSKTVESKQ